MEVFYKKLSFLILFNRFYSDVMVLKKLFLFYQQKKPCLLNQRQGLNIPLIIKTNYYMN
jgi:hypothetical protein